MISLPGGIKGRSTYTVAARVIEVGGTRRRIGGFCGPLKDGSTDYEQNKCRLARVLGAPSGALASVEYGLPPTIVNIGGCQIIQ